MTSKQNSFANDGYIIQNDNLQKDVVYYKSQAVELANEVSAMESNHAEKYSENEKVLSSMNSDITALKKQIQQLENRKKNLELKLEAQSNEADLNTKRQQFEKGLLLESIAELKSIVAEGVTEIKYLQNQNIEINTKCENKINDCKQESDKIEKKLLDKNEKSEEIIKSLETQLSEKLKLLSFYDSSYKALSSDIQFAKLLKENLDLKAKESCEQGYLSVVQEENKKLNEIVLKLKRDFEVETTKVKLLENKLYEYKKQQNETTQISKNCDGSLVLPQLQLPISSAISTTATIRSAVATSRYYNMALRKTNTNQEIIKINENQIKKTNKEIYYNSKNYRNLPIIEKGTSTITNVTKNMKSNSIHSSKFNVESCCQETERSYRSNQIQSKKKNTTRILDSVDQIIKSDKLIYFILYMLQETLPLLKSNTWNWKNFSVYSLPKDNTTEFSPDSIIFNQYQSKEYKNVYNSIIEEIKETAKIHFAKGCSQFNQNIENIFLNQVTETTVNPNLDQDLKFAGSLNENQYKINTSSDNDHTKYISKKKRQIHSIPNCKYQKNRFRDETNTIKEMKSKPKASIKNGLINNTKYTSENNIKYETPEFLRFNKLNNSRYKEKQINNDKNSPMFSGNLSNILNNNILTLLNKNQIDDIKSLVLNPRSNSDFDENMYSFKYIPRKARVSTQLENRNHQQECSLNQLNKRSGEYKSVNKNISNYLENNSMNTCDRIKHIIFSDENNFVNETIDISSISDKNDHYIENQLNSSDGKDIFSICKDIEMPNEKNPKISPLTKDIFIKDSFNASNTNEKLLHNNTITNSCTYNGFDSSISSLNNSCINVNGSKKDIKQCFISKTRFRPFLWKKRRNVLYFKQRNILKKKSMIYIRFMALIVDKIISKAYECNTISYKKIIPLALSKKITSAILSQLQNADTVSTWLNIFASGLVFSKPFALSKL